MRQDPEGRGEIGVGWHGVGPVPASDTPGKLTQRDTTHAAS